MSFVQINFQKVYTLTAITLAAASQFVVEVARKKLMKKRKMMKDKDEKYLKKKIDNDLTKNVKSFFICKEPIGGYCKT